MARYLRKFESTRAVLHGDMNAVDELAGRGEVTRRRGNTSTVN